MFNNYAVVQGVDHIVPVDMYLPGCPPRPEMLIDAILKLHDQVQHTKLGPNRLAEIAATEETALNALPTGEMKGLMRRATTTSPRLTRPSSRQREGGTQDPSIDRIRDTSEEIIGQRQGMFGVEGSGDTSGYGGLTRTVECRAPASRRTAAGWTRWPHPCGAHRVSGTEGAVEKIVVRRGESPSSWRRAPRRRCAPLA